MKNNKNKIHIWEQVLIQASILTTIAEKKEQIKIFKSKEMENILKKDIRDLNRILKKLRGVINAISI